MNRTAAVASRRLIATGLLVSTVAFAKPAFSAPAAPTREHVETIQLVGSMLQRYHLRDVRIDDEVSRRLLDRFIEQLDPLKLYFLSSDIAQFAPFATQLDDRLKRGDASVAFQIYDLYLRRLGERVAFADQLIETDFDFAADESIVTDPDMLVWARTPAELNERWRKRIKAEVLGLRLEDVPLEEIRTRLHRRYKNIAIIRGQPEADEIVESYLSALTHIFDPHSSFLSKSTLEEFRISMELSLEGIGAALRFVDGKTVVQEIIAGGAADADGRLAVGDTIIGVAQSDDAEFTDVVEMPLSKVVKLIRGKSGSVVRLQVEKKAGDIAEYGLTRQTIELKSSAVSGRVIETNERVGGGAIRVGVINIPSFYRDFRGAQANSPDFKSTSRDVRKALAEFEADGGVDAVLIDLRGNGGGALAEAIEVTGLFIDRGPVVQVKEQDGTIKSHADRDPGVAWGGPLVVVTNRLSASASEIFAGAIRDYDRGIIVGDESTHGKGTVQNVLSVPPQLLRFLGQRNERGALKLTIQQFYRVNGDSTQNRGVPSDVVLPSLLDHLELGEEYLDNALEFDQIPAARGYGSLGLVNEQVIAKLRASSAGRIRADEGFGELSDAIAAYEERKDRVETSLNEAVRRAEREALGEELDEADIDPSLAEPEEGAEEAESDDIAEPEIFAAGYYNDELVRITVDYVELLNPATTASR
ncbi:MAG: carboxy terminal-processing peptidase [Planctomycetota bacterium]